MYHANNGLYFKRQDDGSVVVEHWLHGAANAGRADQATVDVLDRHWTMTASEWASVVASVSDYGETGESHTQALYFHRGGKAPTS